MIKKNLGWNVIFILFTVFSIYGQDRNMSTPLKEIILEIEKKHDVKFSFIEEEISIFKIVSPDVSKELLYIIKELESKTLLSFKFVSPTIIVISNNQKLNKPLCGYLLDSETQLPIFNATVRISETNTFVLTDENGFFQLPILSSNPLEISHISYQSKTIATNELYIDDCHKITLFQNIQELNEVFAHKYLTSGIRKKANGTIEIKPKKFGILPGLVEPDVLQTMQQVPGIISADETVANINVRGGTHDQNLFLWNGIRLFQTGHFFGLISALNPNLAHTINISKNGSSAFYGESISSVIDISSRSTTIEDSNAVVGANLINAEFYSKTKTSETSTLEVAGRRSFTDLVATPTYKNYYNRIFQNTEVIDLNTNQDLDLRSTEDFYFYDLTLQFQQKVGLKNEFFIDAILISNELQFTENYIQNYSEIIKNNKLRQQTIGGNFTWKTIWNKNNNSEVTFFGSTYSLDAFDESIENNQILNQENTILDFGIRLKNSHKITKTITFHNGYQLNEIGIRSFDDVNTPQFTRTVKEVLRSHALIAEVGYTSTNNKVVSNIGIRGNYYEKWQLTIIEPRFQFSYALSNPMKIEVLFEQKNQTASQIIDLQQDFFGIEKRRWILSNNETIPIQKSTQASLGFVFRKNNWLLTSEGFYKKVTGITSSSQGFQNQLEFVKVIGGYEVFGTELLIQKQIQNFTTWINYSWNNNNYTFDGYIPPEFANNFEINHSLLLASTYEWKNLKIALGSKWFTGRPSTLPFTNEPVYNTPDNPEIEYNLPNSSNLEDYFQLNFSTSYTFLIGKESNLQFGASLQNITNRKNSINRFYRINQSSNTIEEVNTYSLERTPNAFLKFSF